MTNQQPNRYLAVPESGKGPGVLVLHAWWGLNDFFRGFCDRLAREGFVVLAPDLYHGETAQTIEEAEALRDKMDQRQAAGEILAALKELRGNPAVSGDGVAVIGFSLGASYALWLAGAKPQDIRTVTLFYGTGEGDFAKSQAAFQGHFAENDPFEAAEYIQGLEQALREANHPVTFYTYPNTGHWFFESDRPDAYNPQAAQQAWERMLAFLRERFGVQS